MDAVIEQYVRAVKEDLDTNRDSRDQWEGRAQGAASTLRFLASHGLVDRDTSTFIEQSIPESDSQTQDTSKSKAAALYQKR